ncbi:MAG: hypothetical protein HFJ52_07020 [Clostridia bacterium]|nr:hypothetical protein [Clostridia bacterium]
MLGNTEKIEEDTIEDFKASNIYHILAVSGTHVRNIGNRYYISIFKNKPLKT